MFKKIKQFLNQNKYKILGAISISLGAYAFYKYSTDQTRIHLSSFLTALQQNKLDEVVVIGDIVYFKSALSDWYHTALGNYPVSMLFQQLNKTQGIKFSCQNQNQLGQIVFALALSAGFAAITTKILMPQKFGTINKHPTIIHNHQTFQNFYGSQQIKVKLMQVVEYLKNKQKFQKLGGRIRKGILLHGPPGTGKTMLAKTLANEANLPFLQTCASQFQQIYVGVGPKKIRQIFLRAKSSPEGCIIFIDELDAIGSRNNGHQFSRQTTATINQLLTELDGFQQNDNIVVIGATNRPDLIDPALIRAGRFDIKIKLHLPNVQQRLGIFKALLKKKSVPVQINKQTQKFISQNSQGWSGADIQTLINQSIYNAIRKNADSIKDENIIQAFTQLISK